MRITRIVAVGILMPLVSSADTCSLSGAWEFRKTLDENTNAVKEAWHEVRVPHDWAIKGPFAPDLKGGWTGALPWRGAGEYRRTFSLTAEDRDNLHMDGRAYLEFDGVMGRSEVFLNGQKVGGGTYGYLGYKLDVTKCVRPEGNELLVRATTLQQRSRWYPGGGIFRDVRLRVCPHPHPLPDTLAIRVERLTDDRAEMVATYETPWGPETKRWTVEKPRRWSIEDPYRYELDIYGFKFPYGIREATFDAEKGFFLNGKRVQLKGVDLHADLGPLGMAFDLGAMRRQLLAMKAMGVNAIRTSHNCPAPQLLDLCDEMGFVVWDECFDKWNAYAGRLPEEKLEDYVTDHLKRFVRRDRNHPCVVVWSIGNEINAASAKNPDGVTRERCRLFREAVRSEDTTRPVGIGECDDSLPARGWLDDLDITGWNYARKYAKMKAHAPRKPVLYTESASAVSSFGDSSLPLPEWRTDYRRMTRTCSAYDRHSAWWSDIPDYEFWRMENDRYCGGEFVWTGIDYLGEPTPHDSARSSYFGICDLCVIPKDRFYLYRAHWLPEETTCHLVPNHWNFKAGEKVPVYLYTNGDEAELFLNGRSLGRRTKSARTDYPLDLAYPSEPGKGWLKPHQMTVDVSNQLVTAYYDVCDRYRIRWDAVPYESGELKAVAYRNGKRLAEETVRTCGAAVALKISADPFQPDDPRALRFVQVDVVDAKGLRDPFAEPKVRFSVTGPGELVAVGNSDEHGTVSFRDFKAFPLRFGKALVIVRRTGDGVLTLTAEADGLKSARYDFGGIIRAGAGLEGLKAAQAAVRRAKAAQPNEPWTVVVPAGEVRLSETLAFGPEDSGRPGAPVVWKGEGTVVRGGVDLGPWTDEGEGVVSAAIPKDADGKPLALDMLFVNGERASRSVLPKNRGSFKIPGGEADSRAKTLSTNAAGRVTYAKEWTRLNEDAAAVLDAVAPEDLPYVQMQIRLDWTQARRRVVGWDRERREVVTEAFGGKPRDANNRWCARTAIRFENVRAAFVEPGEWFYDAKAGKVLYRLRAGEAATTLRAVAPAKRLSKLLSVDRAHDLRFESLAFEYADAPQDGVADDPRKLNQTYRSQSAATYDAAVGLRFAERVEFVRCRVARSGNYAFRIADGCRHVALRRCETWDTGAGGVWMGSARQNPPNGELRRAILLPTEPESCAFNVIEDCRFRHGGRFNPEGTAVFVTHASDCRIEHNEIDDWYYSGITVGYTWGYGGSVAQRNRIAYNRISRLGQHELSDMGGIYTLGTSFGTVVCNNVITDVFGYDKSAWGLYADEGSEGIVFENNVISHTEFGGLNQHYGSGCVFRNNIIAYNDERGCLSTSRREFGGVPSRVDIVGNIFYTHKGPLACKGSMEVDGVRAHNVWWKEGGPAADDLDGRSAEEYLSSGRACGDVVADPLFVDAKNGDFRLKPDSPALKLGFCEWDHSLAGPRF